MSTAHLASLVLAPGLLCQTFSRFIHDLAIPDVCLNPSVLLHRSARFLA